MEVTNWTPDASRAIELCKLWAKDVTALYRCEVYLFGSAIYDGGDQFDAQLSDLDLIVLINDELDATERVRRLKKLLDLKAHLEMLMVPTLHRTNCEEPGVSVVPITRLELKVNAHKSGVRHFYSRNIFLNLITDTMSVGLKDAGTFSIADEARHALEYVQKIRNQYLAVGANRTGGLAHYDKADPMPKATARVAAQLIPDPEIGAWYDTRFGLEYLWEELSRRRSESTELNGLYTRISKSRGGRGQRHPLSNDDQLLLVELLFDRAAAAQLDPIATWQVRFGGVPPTEAEQDRIVQALRTIVPDAEILGVYSGSIIVRLRSSRRSYNAMAKLSSLDVLSAFFDVNEVTISQPLEDGSLDELQPDGVIDRIAERIKDWRPRSTDSMRVTESSLASWLEEWLTESGGIVHGFVGQEVLIGSTDHHLRADILMSFRENDQDQRVAIEVMNLRDRNSFFRQVDRARKIALPQILVVIGRPAQFAELQEDIERIARMQGNLRVVTVQVDNG